MSNRMRALLVGWMLVFVIVACSQQWRDEQVLGGGEAPGTQILPEDNAGAPEGQTPSKSDPESKSSRKYDELEIVTLLPQDGIPAIDNPQFLSAEEAEDEYAPDELVIGVNYDGDARAYSIPFLSGHEIVNDTVGGRKIAVTW
jgi:hypothetical protein